MCWNNILRNNLRHSRGAGRRTHLADADASCQGRSNCRESRLDHWQWQSKFSTISKIVRVYLYVCASVVQLYFGVKNYYSDVVVSLTPQEAYMEPLYPTLTGILDRVKVFIDRICGVRVKSDGTFLEFSSEFSIVSSHLSNVQPI